MLQGHTTAIVPCGNPTPKKLPTGGGEWPTFRTAHGTPPKEGGNATSPLHSRGSPTKGTKSEVKTYAGGHHDAPSISKYGSLVQPAAQIAALC